MNTWQSFISIGVLIKNNSSLHYFEKSFLRTDAPIESEFEQILNATQKLIGVLNYSFTIIRQRQSDKEQVAVSTSNLVTCTVGNS